VQVRHSASPAPQVRGRRLDSGAMCVQCMVGATTAAAGVTGIRAWLATRTYAWLTPRRLRFVTAILVATGLVAASVGLGAA
jgi:hypothetical protein